MGERRERLEITLYGGKPWGFSIKGGLENDKPLWVSKLEPKGKAERSGLCIGDIIFSINSVPLSGVRSEAIRLVKTSGINLMLEIERGLPNGQRQSVGFNKFELRPERGRRYTNYQALSGLSQPSYPSADNPRNVQKLFCVVDDEYSAPSAEMSERIPHIEPTNVPAASLSHCRSPIMDRIEDSVTEISSVDDKWMEKESSFKNISQLFDSNDSINMSISSQDQPIRHQGKNRYRNSGRPNSWHALKASEIEKNVSPIMSQSPTSVYKSGRMRSPGNNWHQSPQHRQQPDFQGMQRQHRSRRKSKGWTESGNLKSTLKGDFNGSKDSLLSSSSRHSHLSTGASCCSSKSSGNLSGSRGSLDNLEYYPESDFKYNLSDNTHRNSPSSTQQSPGNVGCKKSIFEKLSHNEKNVFPSGHIAGLNQSHTHHDKSGQTFQEDTDRVAPVFFPPTASLKDDTSCAITNSDASEVFPSNSPMSTNFDKQCNHKLTRDSKTGGIPMTEKSNVNKLPSSVVKTAENTDYVQYADAKIVKTTYDATRGTITVKEVPMAADQFAEGNCGPDNRSVGAAVNEYVQPITSSPFAETQKYIIDQKRRNADFMDKHAQKYGQNEQCTRTAEVYPVYLTTPGIASPVTEDLKTTVNTKQKPAFAPVAYSNDGKCAASKPVTIQSSHVIPWQKKENEETPRKAVITPPRYEHLKDAYSYTNAEIDNNHEDSSETRHSTYPIAMDLSSDSDKQGDHESSSFAKFPQDDGSVSPANSSNNSKIRSTGRYGEIWKTPQNHRRTKSTDSSILVGGSTSAVSGPLPENVSTSKLSLAKPIAVRNPESHKSDKETYFMAKSRKAIYKSELASADDKIMTQLNLTEQNTAEKTPKVTTEYRPEAWNAENSILQALQNYQEKAKASRNPMPSNQTSTFSASPAETNQHKSITLPPGYVPSFSKANLDGSEDDDAFLTQNDEYRNNIKGMSKKVLRVTSFTRKDLELSPSFRTFEQRRQVFEYSSKLATTAEEDKASHSYILHGRSRSQGNELEEGSVPIVSSHSSGDGKDSVITQSGNIGREHTEALPKRKTRPKSAGAPNNDNLQQNWHELKLQQLGLIRNIPKTQSKTGSLPRSTFAGLDAEYSGQQTPSPLQKNDVSHHHDHSTNLPSPEHRRVEIEVPPENSTHSTTPLSTAFTRKQESQKGLHDSQFAKMGTRSAILGFYYKKTGKAIDVDLLAFGNAEKMPKAKFTSSTRLGEQTSKNLKSAGSETQHNTRYGPMRAKSSSLGETGKSTNLTAAARETGIDYTRPGQDQSSLRGKRPSLENLTAESITSSLESKTSKLHQDALSASNCSSQASSNAKSIAKHLTSESPVLSPPHSRPPRLLHSSNASSATTVSTLSSHSSTSSSFGKSYRNVSHPSTLEEHDQNQEKMTGDSTHNDPAQQSLSGVDHSYDEVTKHERSILPKPAMGKPVYGNMGTYKISKGMRNDDPTIKIPVVYPEDFNTTLSLESRSSTQDVRMDDDHSPLPQVPQRRRRKNEMTGAALSSPLPLGHEPISVSVSEEKSSMSDDLSSPRHKVTFSAGLSQSASPKLPDSDLKSTRLPPAPQSMEPAGKIIDCFPSSRHPLPSAPLSGAVVQLTPVISEIHEEDTYKPSSFGSKMNSQNLSSEANNESKMSEMQVDIRNEPALEKTSTEVVHANLLPQFSSSTELRRSQNSILEDENSSVLLLPKKKTLDYMYGILAPTHGLLEAGSRSKLLSSLNTGPNEKQQGSSQLKGDSATTTSNLPASSSYYQTSASKAKIMHIVQEKVEGGEIDDAEVVETEEEVNRKKVELVASMTSKMSELQSVKDLIKIEMKENEELGKHVNKLAESVCTSREHEKFNTFVEEVDKIINLLLSLSGRLARAENALSTLPPDANAEERNSLLKKKEKLIQQHEEAKMLKLNVDTRQKAVSEMLYSYLSDDQFADYEHYIKMKTTLIMEQRELDDKMKLGEEQMQCLRDSLPDDWLEKVEKLAEEKTS